MDLNGAETGSFCKRSSILNFVSWGCQKSVKVRVARTQAEWKLTSDAYTHTKRTFEPYKSLSNARGLVCNTAAHAGIKHNLEVSSV